MGAKGATAFAARKLVEATPFAPAVKLLDLLGVTTQLPGWQSFLAKTMLTWAAKKPGKVKLGANAVQQLLVGASGPHGLSMRKTLSRLGALPATAFKPGGLAMLSQLGISPNNNGGGNMFGNLLGASGGFGGVASGGGFDWGGLANAALGATFGYLNTKAQTKQMKQLMRMQMMGAGGGMPQMFSGVPAAGGGWSLPQILGGAAGGLALGLPSLGGLTDALPGGLEEGGTGLFGPDMFSATSAGARQNMLDAPHPTSGERVYWRPVGRPVLFSGDLSFLKRTRKTIGRFCGPAGIQRARRRVRRR